MIALKIYYRFICWLKIVFYKIIYGGRFSVSRGVSFRAGFHAVVEGDGKIVLGKRVFFNNYCSLASMALIKIGDNTVFGENVKVYDHNHVYRQVDIPIKEQGYTSSPISIGSNCWIASNVVITKGVTIGNHCVIGAGCIVYEDVPDNSILFSNGTIKRIG